jgi:hypothetical protein
LDPADTIIDNDLLETNMEMFDLRAWFSRFSGRRVKENGRVTSYAKPGLSRQFVTILSRTFLCEADKTFVVDNRIPGILDQTTLVRKERPNFYSSHVLRSHLNEREKESNVQLVI